VKDCNRFDPIREHDVVNYVPKPPEARGTHVAPDDAVQLGHLLDSPQDVS